MRWLSTLVVLVLVCCLGVAPAQAAPADRTEQLIAELQALLPADYEARIAEAAHKAGISETELHELAKNVIDPDEHQCSTTDLTTWLLESIKNVPLIELFVLILTGAASMPIYDRLFFTDPAERQSYGVNGEHTKQITGTFKDLQKFWDIPSQQIHLAAAHGTVLLDAGRVARTMKYLLGLSDEQARQFGEVVVQIVSQPHYLGGNHPLLSFNAVAYSAQGKEDFPGLGVLPDKIVMGDGVLAGFDAIGLGDVAPQAILAHEFGHHIQFQRGLFESPLTGPEATRRIELMADAFAAYYLAHQKGGKMRWQRVKDFQRTFYNVGDCAFGSPGHHGTPLQRQRAAEWGYSLVVDESFRNRIMSTREFARRFERALPTLVAPDAPAVPHAA